MRKRLIFVIVAALAGGMLAGCGGGGDSAAPPGASNNTGSTDVTTGNDAYDALLKKARTSSYRVTYKSGDNGTVFTISHTPAKSAFITGDGTMLINNGTDSVTCSNVGSSDAKCFKSPTGAAGVDAMIQGFFGIYSAVLATGDNGVGLGFDVSKSSGETIAGRDAKCAEISGGAFAGKNGHFKVCVDKEKGVLLLGESTTDGKTNRIEATEAGDPKPGDFDPPAPTTDLSVPTQP